MTIYSPIFSVMLTLPLLGKISSKHLLSRKDLRKQERQAKKQCKAVHHNSKCLDRILADSVS